MLNLMPPEEKKALTREYMLRTLVVALWFVASLLCIALLLLMPTLVSLQIKKGVLLEEEERIKGEISAQGTDVVDAFLQETNTRAALLAAYQPRQSIHSLVTLVIEHAPAGVTLSSINYSTQSGERLIMRGVADKRESAIVFVRQLETEEVFESVDLPISNLARNENIEFTMTIDIARAKPSV